VAKVLIIESDSVFAAVLADRLHVAGHEVRRLADGDGAVARVLDEHADLLMLNEAPNAGLGVVEALRGQASTRSVPVLMLSDRSAPSDRMAALRAGVDDYVTRPCDLEELLLRVDRLLANRTATLQVLQGDLASHPLWEVVQYLGQARKSGVLRVRSLSGAGSIDLRDGAVLEARCQGLRGREALLALLSLEEGGFRFDPSLPGAGSLPEPAAELKLQELLLESAWLRDEIGNRRRHLPATGEPLQALRPNLPEVDEDFRSLPLRRILDRVLKQPGVRLFDLIADDAEAPVSTRLAVALLVETGAIAPQTRETEAELQNTREISSTILLDLAVEDLMAAATEAEFAGSTFPYLLLVEPEVWPVLRRLLTEAPGFRQNEGLRRLAQQVEQQRAGSATLPARRGELSLHVQVLAGPSTPEINAAMGYCAGILVWVRSGENGEGVRALVQRLETGGPAGATGMLVAGDDDARRKAPELIHGARRWRSTPHEPQSLLGVLRLLHPPDA
jgi:CheY-like chemotaxis protein